MEKRIVSIAARVSGFRFSRAVFIAALASGMFGQVPTASVNPNYPLAVKTRWTYQLRQEFGPGVHPTGPDASLVKGNVLETTLVSEVTGFDMIGGARYARVESRHDGRLWMTEWLRLTPKGLFLGKTNEDGQERLITPPQKTLSPHAIPGETWSWKASEALVSVQTRVVGK